MKILNGRTLAYLYGKFTSQTPTGASVVDYVIASEELLKDVIYFHVHSCIPVLSDCLHSKVSVFFLNSSFMRDILHNRNTKMPDCFKWNKFSSEKFKNALHDKEISQKIKSFMDNKFDT